MVFLQIAQKPSGGQDTPAQLAFTDSSEKVEADVGVRVSATSVEQGIDAGRL